MAGCAEGPAACQTRCLQRVAMTIGLAYDRHRSGMLKGAKYDGRQAFNAPWERAKFRR
jgi:hypothetical protein